MKFDVPTPVNCRTCATPVDASDLHPDSLEPPDSEEWYAQHARCADVGTEDEAEMCWVTVQ